MRCLVSHGAGGTGTHPLFEPGPFTLGYIVDWFDVGAAASLLAAGMSGCVGSGSKVLGVIVVSDDDAPVGAGDWMLSTGMPKLPLSLFVARMCPSVAATYWPPEFSGW